MSRFDYVKYDQAASEKQAIFKTLIMTLEAAIDNALPKSRAVSLVHTKLEEAYMWIGKALCDEQIEFRSAELEDNRSNE